jgi:nucleoside-diphosphate-sugar epimerase
MSVQLSLIGKTPVVVKEGLTKSMPNKLYIIHTKDERDYNYEQQAKNLKKQIEDEQGIIVDLLKVDAFDLEQIINTILTTIHDEREKNPSLSKRDFVINITGGTNLMAAAASTAAYFSGSRVIYAMDRSKYRGDDPVKELPMPPRPENDNRGRASLTTAIILEKISDFKKCTYKMLLEAIRQDHRCRKKQRIEYHLRKLKENNLISITLGWEYNKGGKLEMDHKKRTIMLTSSGSFCAKFPDLVGSIP